ncbi:carbamoyl-phosphate synthase, small subunit [Dethiosulfovibrio peptidovorans DSM 11002]|uniref:Carbamoyl phosphate synthase small chain n=1 Tax=Dethiosulfovibrio peptidovorans DSM 11002 TaxID=469381 RepID=D2Z8T8_9BACT|nr:carbamoyl phosphate synthase small subunit [Dethiosulfovibrio peptidovorans]EFC91885.1 carbamoyl-phosphate synthase, small subunit [Dethiosulfovibrio peptidovorans DSM 11002]
MYQVALSLSDGTSKSCLSTIDGVDIEGELVFTTAYPGYSQSITDPSYHGQILVFAFPCIGIYGLDEVDFQSSRPWVKAVVVQRLQDTEGTFEKWLAKWGVPVITGLDCRSLVLKLREIDTPMARISETREPPIVDTLGGGLVSEVSSSAVRNYGSGSTSVALIDYGTKMDIVRRLVDRGCSVTLLPHSVDPRLVLNGDFDGVLLSNGPGDPSLLPEEIGVVRELLGKIPILGICLGCQILALACGAETVRLPYGHRGGNHPVLDLRTGRAMVTSQNHGYAIDESSLKNTDLDISFRHLSDGTVEGISDPALRISGVQFHPEAGAGPMDGLWIFDDFVDTLRRT